MDAAQTPVTGVLTCAKCQDHEAMARVTDPLFSSAASGRIGTALLFRAGKSGPRVSRPPDPRRTNQAPPSTAQAAVRARYSAAASAWRALAPAEREHWNARARADPRNLHGWSLYIEQWKATEPNETYLTWDAPAAHWDSGELWG